MAKILLGAMHEIRSRKRGGAPDITWLATVLILVSLTDVAAAGAEESLMDFVGVWASIDAGTPQARVAFRKNLPTSSSIRPGSDGLMWRR